MTAPDPRLGEIEARANNPFRTSMDGIAQLDEDRDYLLAELRKAQDALGRVEGLADTWWANFPSKARAIHLAVAAATGGGES